MRILLFDGVETGHHPIYAARLAVALSDLGEEVIVAVPERAASRIGDALGGRADLVTVRRFPRQGPLPARTVRAAVEYREFQRLSRRLGVDVTHHLYADGAEVGWLLASGSRHGPPAFATLFWPPLPATPVPASVALYRRSRLSAVTRLLASGSLAGLFVHSSGAYEQVASRLGDRERVRLVPDPVPPTARIPPAIARRRLGLPPDGRVLLFFGGLRHEKGPDILAAALSRLPGKWTAVFAGEDRTRSAYDVIDQGDGHLPRERIIVHNGFVPEADVPLYFCAADVVILPYRRGFAGTSGVLQQAAAAATPVVASDVGDVGATVRTHGLGVVVQPEDPEALARGITLLIEDLGEWRRRVAAAAEAYVARFGYAELARRVRDLYRSAPNGRG